MRLLLGVLALLYAWGVLAQSYPGVLSSTATAESNDAPVWNSTPSPTATEGVASSYDVAQHFSDPDGDTITLSDAGGCTLPTGVTVDDGNDELDFSTGTSAGTTTGCTLSIDDGTNDAVTSSAFPIEILSAGEADATVNSSGTADYTTIAAAIAGEGCGVTIEIEDGSSGVYNEAIVTDQDCTLGNEVIIQAASGHTPEINGASAVVLNGTEASYHCAHEYWIIGEGMTVQGTNDPQEGEDQHGQPNRAAHASADHCTFKGDYRNSRFRTIAADDAVQWLRVTGVDARVTGSAHSSNNDDTGDSLSHSLPISDVLFEDTFVGEGGHSLGNGDADRLFYRDMVGRNDWVNHWYTDPQATERGNRSFVVRDGSDQAVRRAVTYGVRKAIDSANTAAWKLNGRNVSASQMFVLDTTAGGGCIDTGAGVATAGYGPSFLDHITCAFSSGPFYFGIDSGDSGINPVYLKNWVVSDATLDPGSFSMGFGIQLKINTNNNPEGWEELLFVDGVVADQDYDIRVLNQNGSTLASGTLTEMETNFPANFQNITIADPNFVSETFPSGTDFTTAWSQATTNFLPQAAAAVGTGQPLTRVDGAQTNDTTIEVDEDGWFRGPMGWSHVTGDTITLCGTTTTVVDDTDQDGDGTDDSVTLGDGQIEVADALTCSDNAPIYRGSDSSPNMGAAL